MDLRVISKELEEKPHDAHPVNTGRDGERYPARFYPCQCHEPKLKKSQRIMFKTSGGEMQRSPKGHRKPNFKGKFSQVSR